MSDIATKLTTIAENQQKVYAAGYAKGQAAGGDTEAAYQQGVVDGKQAGIDAMIDRTLTSIESNAEVVAGSAFYNYVTLNSASFPQAKTIGSAAFYGCTSLTSVYFPEATNVGGSAFRKCTELEKISLPKATYMAGALCYDSTALKTIEFGAKINIASQAFYNCTSLMAVILKSEAPCTLGDTNAFTNTPIANGKGFIYVPYDLLDSYKSATNWSNFANQICAIDAYSEITGG